jgi:two-component system OmpR family sensor kinase
MANPFLPPKPDAVPLMSRGTLSRKLVMRTTLLVAVVTVILSTVTLTAFMQVQTQELDRQLTQALAGRQGCSVIITREDQFQQGNEGLGLVRLLFCRGTWWIASTPDASMAEDDLQTLLEPLTVLPEGTSTQKLGSLGTYRIMVSRSGIVGLPYNQISGPLVTQGILVVLFNAAAIGAAFLVARKVVERTLRPLNRLADTAAKVSNLPLAAGEVDVPVRVDEADTNPESEVGRVGQALNQMLDHVEGALEARHRSETQVRQFVADASHELRNPLAAIRGYAELTRHGREELPEDIGHALERIEGESDRMSALVEDLLLLARLDSQPTLDLKPTDVTEVVLNAVSDARAAGPDHQWQLELPDDAITAPADQYRLQQVVANLLANARSHTPAGTTVWTRLRSDAQWVWIEVIDNGPGVPAEIRDHVFERFTRADVSRGGASTGLGLAIVAAVVGAHHGSVTLDSAEGHTRFTISIPATAREPELVSAGR